MWNAGTPRFTTRRMRMRFVSVASTIGVALAVVAGAAPAANVVTTVSGWSWSSPQPQGVDLNAVAFAGGRGYAVGPHGTALVSGDGGLTWTGLHSGTSASLSVVRVIGANTVIVAGGCDARRSDDGGATFTRLPFDSGDAGCPSPVASLSFPNSSIGYVVLQDGTVLRTADGGQTFSRSGAVPGAAAAFFTSADAGFVGGAQGVYETSDDGVTFKRVLAVPVTDVDFPSPQVGYAVGAGAYYATSDGGQTWTSRSLATLVRQHRVHRGALRDDDALPRDQQQRRGSERDRAHDRRRADVHRADDRRRRAGQRDRLRMVGAARRRGRRAGAHARLGRRRRQLQRRRRASGRAAARAHQRPVRSVRRPAAPARCCAAPTAERRGPRSTCRRRRTSPPSRFRA